MISRNARTNNVVEPYYSTSMAGIESSQAPRSIVPSPYNSSQASSQPSPRDSSPPSLAWRRTVDRYLVDSSLTAEEQKTLRLNSLDEFLSDLTNVDLSQLQKSRVQKYMTKVRPVLMTLDRFGKAIDVITNADPYGILNLVWGSIRMVIVVSNLWY